MMPAFQRGDGAGRVRFEAAAGRSARVVALEQRAPVRFLFPHSDPGEPPMAVAITTSGGLTGGDRIRLSIEAGPGAVATATTQAAEKLYRSLGPATRIETRLTVGAGAWLEWLPQETILFDGARPRRSVHADVADGGRLLAVDMLVFGRIARGEAFRRGALADDWRVAIGGRLAWADALRLEEPMAPLFAAAAGLDGARALATLVTAGGDATAARDAVRTAAEAFPSVRIGASAIGAVTVARFLGSDPPSIRAALAAAAGAVRARLAGLPDRAPRIWYG